jgi:hypothetical protein
MLDPVLVNRLAQKIHAERLSQADKVRRCHFPDHDSVWRARLGRRMRIYIADLFIAIGQRLKQTDGATVELKQAEGSTVEMS